MAGKRGSNSVQMQPGQRYGRLVILSEAEPTPTRKGYSDRKSLVRCDCGTEKVVGFYHLRNGAIQSCGCLQKERAAAAGHARMKHGESSRGNRTKGSVEFNAWVALRARCRDPEHPAYKHYGGRGISVCERWSDFEAFLADMGRRPTPKHSIDRKDNDGHYEPSNCRWATKAEQAQNRRRPKKKR